MGKFMTFLTYVVPLLALVMYLSPLFTIHLIILVDFFTPWAAFKSDWVSKYHRSLVDPLPEIPAKELYEIPVEDMSKEELYFRSNQYTTPVVIRNALAGTSVLKKWNNISWWIENYGDEEVICKYVETGTDEKKCTIKEALSPDDPSKQLYVTGEARMFMRRPELGAMVKTDMLEAASPGTPVFTQLFLGYKGMGSDMHAAMGCNIFRQIVGQKTWWLVPMSETALVYPSLNPNGFSAHSLTVIGKGDDVQSPWLKKLNRWEVTLNPGDVLLNPPWVWHGIVNTGGGEGGLSVGVPTRYAVEKMTPSFKNNWLFSIIGVACISWNYGLDKFTSSAEAAQDGIERARNARAAELSKEREEMERAM
jgi:hypothetical protein